MTKDNPAGTKDIGRGHNKGTWQIRLAVITNYTSETNIAAPHPKAFFYALDSVILSQETTSY